jgi:adenosylcobinamide-phosphate synthase
MHPGWVLALAILAAAALVDWLIGEYPLPLHPVVWMGKVIAVGVWLAPRRGWWRQLLYGVFLAAGVAGLSVGLTLLVLRWAAPFPVLTIVVGTFLLKASFALRALGRAADGVLRPLAQGDLPRAREALRSLCSRDPSNLSEQELLAATVESVAENASDSFIAPLFYYLLFGVAGAVGYRAVNTLDAMVGYTSPRYLLFGRVAARLDDVVNLVPARVTGALTVLAAPAVGGSTARAWTVLRRDGGRHPSPNAGRPEAAAAGALGVRVGGTNVYGGHVERRPDLGEGGRAPRVEDVRRAVRLSRLVGLAGAVLAVGLAAALGRRRA